MNTVKGMVQVLGITYRIVRKVPGSYAVCRVLDDKIVGSFRLGTPLEVDAREIDQELLRRIARTAIQQAKTTWAGPLVVGG